MEIKYNEALYKLTPSMRHSSKLIHFSAPVEIFCILGVNVKLLPKLVFAKCCAVFTRLVPSHVGEGKVAWYPKFAHVQPIPEIFGERV